MSCTLSAPTESMLAPLAHSITSLPLSPIARSLSLTLALSFQLSLNVLLPVYFNLFQCECPSPSMHFSLSSPDFGSHIIIIIIAPSLYPPLSPCLSISSSPAISLSPPPSLCPSPSIPISLSLSFSPSLTLSLISQITVCDLILPSLLQPSFLPSFRPFLSVSVSTF